LLTLLVLFKLCLGKALNCFDFESDIVSKLVVANPDRVSTLAAGFVLQNLIRL
jgi:hypothetical protein